MEAGLYVVSTPIGNLSDVTRRAVDTLREATVCYAEDTRRTGRFLASLGISLPLRSLHAHNEAARARELVERVREGQACVLVSDAGTPAVSDPGRRVVEAVLDAGLPVVPIPGPSAVVAALAVSGLPAETFLFLGFPPKAGAERSRWLRRAAGAGMTVVAFESPRRVGALLSALAESGLADRLCVVCRELTKLHEEVVRGPLGELAHQFAGQEVRGEVTLVFQGGSDEVREPDLAEATRLARDLAGAGSSTRDIAERLQEAFGLSRNDAYELGLRASRPTSEDA